MDLYRGRLKNAPGAIALRLRWYGEEDPKNIFVERKTHRESWTGELSVKERFSIQENHVISLLQGKYDIETEVENLVKKGKNPRREDIGDGSY